MKNFFTILILLFVPFFLGAQTHSMEDFGSGVFPPAGWTIDAHAGNWSANNSNNAGGVAPEARFNWSPSFVGESRLICPPMDLTGVTALKVEFKYMLDHYGGPYTIGIATRSGGGTWNTVWELVNPTASVPATTEFVTINNSDVGASDFEICWFFSGDSYNLNYWYIDDCRLFTPYDHDIMVKNIPIETQYIPGAVVVPKGVVNNFGQNSETFDVTCEIKINGSSVYSETISSITLAPDEEQTITFPDYTASAANEVFECTVTANLVGDMDPSNDDCVKWLNTYTTLRDMVILEIGTGTWCQYCPGAAMGADELVSNGHNVGVVENHNGDSFTNSYSDARNAYYGISGYPTAVFGGTLYFVGGDHNLSMYDNYLPLFESRKVINSAFAVGIFGQNTDLDYTLNIQLAKLATIQPDWDNLVLHLVLTESHIPFSWQGQTEVSFVERLMVPDELGTAVDLINNSNLTVDLNFSLDPSWVKEECELVAFIQNLNTKEILQGSKVKLLELLPVSVEVEMDMPFNFALSQNYPNPFNPATQIKFAVPERSQVTIKIFDLTGQEVTTLVNEVKDVGTYDINFDASGLSSGVYFYQMRAGNFNSVKKMCVLK